MSTPMKNLVEDLRLLKRTLPQYCLSGIEAAIYLISEENYVIKEEMTMLLFVEFTNDYIKKNGSIKTYGQLYDEFFEQIKQN